MPQSTLVKKLGIHPGMLILILNPPPDYLQSLTELPAEVVVSLQPAGLYDLVQLFIRDSAEFQTSSPAALKSVRYDGLFWLCYPKKSGAIKSDLSREAVWQLMDGSGLRPVSQISIDDSWSALRFRPIERVGK